MSRLSIVFAVAALVAGAFGVLRFLPESAAAQTRSAWVHHRHFFVPLADGRSRRVLATWVRRSDGLEFPRRERPPVVIALHGAREARLSETRASIAWGVDYRLDQAFGALLRGYVTADDYGRLVRADHLRAVNEALRQRPFRGLVVVTPYTPNLLPERVGADSIREFGDFLAGPVLAKIRESMPVARNREGAGIDGVSLGGRLSLEIGLSHPEAFGSVGAIQPAIGADDVEPLLALARGRSETQSIRILTSDEDVGLPSARAFSEGLRNAHVAHELLVSPGEHGYAFNRGPGAMELLLFHHRALRTEPR